jgi:hypothetical protein
MRKLIAILAILSLIVCSCKTKYIETVHYQPVEVHDTVSSTVFVRDSITLHDSVYIHQKGDTVFSEKWRTEYRWHTKHDTLYQIREIPIMMTDTICTIKEVPVDKIVYKQRWWQNALSTVGGLFLLGLLISLLLHKKWL